MASETCPLCKHEHKPRHFKACTECSCYLLPMAWDQVRQLKAERDRLVELWRAAVNLLKARRDSRYTAAAWRELIDDVCDAAEALGLPPKQEKGNTND